MAAVTYTGGKGNGECVIGGNKGEEQGKEKEQGEGSRGRSNRGSDNRQGRRGRGRWQGFEKALAALKKESEELRVAIEKEQNSIIETRNELLDGKQVIKNTQREIVEQRVRWMFWAGG